MARELPIRNGRLTTDLDAAGHKIKNLPPGEGFTQEQADWNQSDSTKPDFIKNKPAIPAPVTVDSALSETSENPVQNKVVTAALAKKLSRAEAEAGFTEWVVAGLVDGERVYSPPSLVPGTTQQWSLRIMDSGGGLRAYMALSDDGKNATNLVFNGDRITATRTRIPTMADLALKADKSEMSVTPGTGSNADKTTIQLKTGTSATVLTSHQTWSEVKPSGGIPPTDLAGVVQTSLGKANTAVQPSGIAVLMPMYQFTQCDTDLSDEWVFEGTSPGEGYKYLLQFSDGTWYLIESGTTPGDDTLIDTLEGTGDETSLTFQTAGVTATRGYVATVSPYTSATYTADSSAAAFEIAVGALPTGVTGKVRDCVLVIDCTGENAVAPTVTWPSNFHPRTDAATDLAIVEAGKRAVFYISEYTSGEFAVGGWVETAGGSGT